MFGSLGRYLGLLSSLLCLGNFQQIHGRPPTLRSIGLTSFRGTKEHNEANA